MNTYVVCVYRQGDIGNVISQLENKDGYICGLITIPFWNISMQPIGNQYAIVYQSKEEINVEVQC